MSAPHPTNLHALPCKPALFPFWFRHVHMNPSWHAFPSERHSLVSFGGASVALDLTELIEAQLLLGTTITGATSVDGLRGIL